MSIGDEGDAGRSSVYIGILLTLCGVAVLLNVLAVYVLGRYNKLKRSVDVFLVNLATTDILRAGLLQPVHFGTAVGPGENFGGGNVGCKLIMFIPLVAILAAIFTIGAIAVDRYRVIIRQKTLYRKGAVIAIGIIWTLSIVISAPQLYEYNIFVDFDKEYNVSYRSCGSEGVAEQFQTVYSSIVFIVAYGIPLIALVICYTSICRFLWKRENNLKRSSLSSCSSYSKSAPERGITLRNMRVLKMLLAICVTFVLLWTPYFIIFAMTEITNTDHMEHLASWPHLVSRTLTVISAVSNPAIFLVFSKHFHIALYSAMANCRYLPSVPVTSDETTDNVTSNQQPMSDITPSSVSTVAWAYSRAFKGNELVPDRPSTNPLA